MASPDYNIDMLVEIPNNSFVKYEYDKEEKFIRVDRVLHTCMAYPGNYGYIEKTLAEDADPIDVLLIADYKLHPLSKIRIRLVGVLLMTDEKGKDEKLLAVPHDSVDPTYHEINDVHDIPKHILKKIKHFFEHYKDTEPNKFVKVEDFADKKEAMKLYDASIERYKMKNDSLYRASKIPTQYSHISDWCDN